MNRQQAENFYQDDEPPAKLAAAFERGRKGRTGRYGIQIPHDFGSVIIRDNRIVNSRRSPAIVRLFRSRRTRDVLLGASVAGAVSVVWRCLA